MVWLHIANTNFEAELEVAKPLPLLELLSKPKFAIQLQYLPLLYKEKEDGVLVTFQSDKVQEDIFHLGQHVFSKNDHLVSWGHSESIQNFCLQKGCKYINLHKDCVKKVNSKLFSFEVSPKLKGAKIIDDIKDLPQKGVLKNAFGFSARGHFLLDGTKDPTPFLAKEFAKGHSVIYEPWVERVLDFSTQWLINEEGNIIYLGATVLQNTYGGAYLGTICGEEKVLFGKFYPFLKEHQAVCLDILEKVKLEGYQGNVGIDSMIYKEGSNEKLQPIVEINARKTLGFSLLSFWKKNNFEGLMHAYFTTQENAKQPLLPSCIFLDDKKIVFPRQLTFDLISPFL
jgi:hypothetical protein